MDGIKMNQRDLFESVKLSGKLAWRRDQSMKYAKSLTNENLLLPYYLEAGLKRITYLPDNIHGGWDSPLSQIRGTVCSHWLSTAAELYVETKDGELKGRAEYIVDELGRCQEENGGEWCFSIPEKYLLWLKEGTRTWAPQYVCHKTMRGLLDVYKAMSYKKALDIVEKAANWFLRYTDDISDERMREMMWEETGALMEFFADLYLVTENPDHLELMRRYERRDLYDLLEAGENPLVNMHANSTIPEIHGAARAYEVTGEERYRKLVERYWEIAVDECEMFVTGSQTAGEGWTPPHKHAHRLGKTNQEHCVVYNMMRLADYLFRWTGEAKYADYWERNLYNGIYAQGFWHDEWPEQAGGNPVHPGYTYVAYHLPLHAGAKKVWGSATGDFWCCHNTLLEANASFPMSLYFQSDKGITIAQYQDASAEVEISGSVVKLSQRIDECTSEIIRIEKVNREIQVRPDFDRTIIKLECEKPTRFEIAFRSPWWLSEPMIIEVNGERLEYTVNEKGFACVERKWSNEEIVVTLPKQITVWPLPDQPENVAFMYGPVALAGLVDEERTIYYANKPEEVLIPSDERRWATWLTGWKTVGQPVNFYFTPIYEIGHEKYTVYFPVEKK